MRKVLAFMLAVVMVFSLTVTAFAATVTPEVSTTAVTAGEDVVVTLTLEEDMTGIVGFLYWVYFDETLFSLKSSELGTATAVEALKTDGDGRSYYAVNFLDTDSVGKTIAAGTIATLTFTALQDITEEQTTSFELVNKGVMDANFSYIEDGTVENGIVTITVAPVPAATYTVTLTEGEGYTITASEGSESPVTEGGSYAFTVTLNDGFEGTPVVKANETELTAVDGVYTIENITADQTVTVSGITAKTGTYIVAASADVTANVNDNVTISVNVTGHADTTVTGYNDYDVTLTYDPAKLTYVSASGADADAVITNDAAAGTVRITGHGGVKEFSQAVVTLTFTATESGNHDVTISSAQIDNSGHAIANNAAAAAVSDSVTVVKVAYPVTLPEGFTGESSVLPGEDYDFTAPDDGEYMDITVTVDGTEVTPEIDGSTYTIPDVDGEVIVTAEGKTYNVIASGTNATVTAEPTAQYGKDYSFTVTPDSGYALTAVSVMIGDAAVSYSTDSNGAYVIAGKDIKGDITITVTAAAQAANTTQIIFSGIPAEEVVGGLNQIATNGQDFLFELNEVEAYTYTVTVGDTTLTPDADGKYTIPGDMINGTTLTVTITKTEKEPLSVEVSVSEYITLDEGVMWLITATDGDKVLSYGEEGTMYWSDQYNAYCWLVVSSGTETDVKAAAEAAIAEAAEGTTAPVVSYDFDVNQTGVVDINDAQLAYDMYTAVYADFERVSMDRFLEADLNGDGKVYTEDVAAIVNQIHPSQQNG